MPSLLLRAICQTNVKLSATSLLSSMRTLADEFGYQIELLRWEDTAAGSGRPQELINQYVDRCDLFIGLIWKRWGTPPDKDGKFSSGFHEEFERSMARRANSANSGSPEIALFFKEIPKEFMEDPGGDLKRVLEFKEKLIAEKEILFKEFPTVRELEPLVRKKVIAYVKSVREADVTSEPSEVRTKPAEPEPERDKGRPDTALVPTEDFAFLENFVDRIGQEDAMDNLSASDVARFRLLANSISLILPDFVGVCVVLSGRRQSSCFRANCHGIGTG